MLNIPGSTDEATGEIPPDAHRSDYPQCTRPSSEPEHLSQILPEQIQENLLAHHDTSFLSSSLVSNPENKSKTSSMMNQVPFRNFQFGAKKIDVFSRFGFPLVFAIFNVWYWSYYLTQTPGELTKQSWINVELGV